MAAPLGLAQVILGLRGRGDRQMQAIVRGIFDAGLADTMERIPYRAMEVRWVASLLDPTRDLDPTGLLTENVLLKRVHPVSMSRSTGYGMTHGLMYATNFGAKPPPGCLDTALVQARIDAGLAWVVVNDDLDLLIEFIIAATLLRQPWSPYVWLAWELWNGVIDEIGFLPSPSFDPRQFADLTGPAAAAYAFRHVYHTAYVAGLLCCILLTTEADVAGGCWASPQIPVDHAAEACSIAASRGRAYAGASSDSRSGAPSAIFRTTEEILDRVSSLLAEMLPDHVQWSRTVPKAGIDRVMLAQVLGDAAIIHAARQYDIPKLVMALEAMIAAPISPSLTVVEGALFLTRQQLQDGCFGAHFLNPDSRSLSVAQQSREIVSDCLAAYAGRFATRT